MVSNEGNNVEDAHAQLAKPKVIRRKFWSKFKVVKSPGDGHCFLYSIVESYNSQHPNKPEMCKDILIKRINDEVVDNFQHYLPFIDDMSPDNLFCGLYDYIENKSYKTSFGYLVPEITSRALGMGIVVIHKHGDDDITSAVGNCDNPGEITYVYYHKDDEHYDGTVRTADWVPSDYVKETDEIDVDNIPYVGNGNEVSDGVWENDCFEIYKTSDQVVDLTQDIKSTSSLSVPVETSFSRKHSVDLCLWNINGLTRDKLNDQILGKYFSRFDIIILTETWSDGEGNYELYNYKYIDFKREYRHVKAKRASGGIGVFIKLDVCHAVEIFRNSRDTVVWLKFKKEYLKNSTDLYLGAVYLAPEFLLYKSRSFYHSSKWYHTAPKSLHGHNLWRFQRPNKCMSWLWMETFWREWWRFGKFPPHWYSIWR